jgi:CSLREA domain-containing protein
VRAARLVPLIALLAVLLTVIPASADTFKPTRFDDPAPGKCKRHDCSLREAVIAANASSSVKRKLVLSKGRYRLSIPEAPADPNDASGGDLDLHGGLTIRGMGAGKTTVSGEGISRVFHPQGTFTDYRLSGLTIRGGVADGDGGGIYANNPGGTVKLTRLALKGNSAESGGGIYSAAGELTVSRSTIGGSDASAYGGGIFLPALGGTNQATALIRASTIARNHAGVGGGVAVDGSDVGGFPNPPDLRALNSTFALNEADVSGGGLSAIQSSDVTLDNSTVAYNAADLDNSGGGNGGGVYQSTSADFRLYDSIVQGNTVGTSGEGPTCAGQFTMIYVNVTPQGGASCSFLGGSVTQGELDPPNLGPLADNGGPTQTVKLLTGSVAVGFSDNGCPKRDQRGKPRPEVDCDAGAFERKKP